MNGIINGDVYDSGQGYQTCDLYLAAFFISAGCKMLTSDTDSKTRRVYFVFEKNPIIQELRVKYFSMDARVDALSFSNNIKSLKSLCHNLASN
jgi:ssRNA-specific RNase YbeY (16S rRNA maturation enzyme)